MKNMLRESEHLLRLAGVLIAGVVVFLLVRHALVPAGFGELGHYRAPALKEIRQQRPRYAGRDACAVCHDDVAATKSKGKHAGIGCEACHGPQYEHSENPGDVKPKLPEVANLCRVCHEADPARPRTFPQVATREHAKGEPCNSCHQPHSPKIE